MECMQSTHNFHFSSGSSSNDVKDGINGFFMVIPPRSRYRAFIHYDRKFLKQCSATSDMRSGADVGDAIPSFLLGGELWWAINDMVGSNGQTPFGSHRNFSSSTSFYTPSTCSYGTESEKTVFNQFRLGKLIYTDTTTDDPLIVTAPTDLVSSGLPEINRQNCMIEATRQSYYNHCRPRPYLFLTR